MSASQWTVLTHAMWKMGAKALCDRQQGTGITSGVSVDAPMTWQLRSLNSSERSENAMISVGHTKVKSLG